jgi:hypothetical protein
MKIKKIIIAAGILSEHTCFPTFFPTTSLSPLQQFVIKTQFNYLLINFTKKQLKVQF